MGSLNHQHNGSVGGIIGDYDSNVVEFYKLLGLEAPTISQISVSLTSCATLAHTGENYLVPTAAGTTMELDATVTGLDYLVPTAAGTTMELAGPSAVVLPTTSVRVIDVEPTAVAFTTTTTSTNDNFDDLRHLVAEIVDRFETPSAPVFRSFENGIFLEGRARGGDADASPGGAISGPQIGRFETPSAPVFRPFENGIFLEGRARGGDADASPGRRPPTLLKRQDEPKLAGHEFERRSNPEPAEDFDLQVEGHEFERRSNPGLAEHSIAFPWTWRSTLSSSIAFPLFRVRSSHSARP